MWMIMKGLLGHVAEDCGGHGGDGGHGGGRGIRMTRGRGDGLQ